MSSPTSGVSVNGSSAADSPVSARRHTIVFTMKPATASSAASNHTLHKPSALLLNKATSSSHASSSSLSERSSAATAPVVNGRSAEGVNGHHTGTASAVGSLGTSVVAGVAAAPFSPASSILHITPRLFAGQPPPLTQPPASAIQHGTDDPRHAGSSAAPTSSDTAFGAAPAYAESAVYDVVHPADQQLSSRSNSRERVLQRIERRERHREDGYTQHSAQHHSAHSHSYPHSHSHSHHSHHRAHYYGEYDDDYRRADRHHSRSRSPSQSSDRARGGGHSHSGLRHTQRHPVMIEAAAGMLAVRLLPSVPQPSHPPQSAAAAGLPITATAFLPPSTTAAQTIRFITPPIVDPAAVSAAMQATSTTTAQQQHSTSMEHTAAAHSPDRDRNREADRQRSSRYEEEEDGERGRDRERYRDRERDRGREEERRDGHSTDRDRGDRADRWSSRRRDDGERYEPQYEEEDSYWPERREGHRGSKRTREEEEEEMRSGYRLRHDEDSKETVHEEERRRRRERDRDRERDRYHDMDSEQHSSHRRQVHDNELPRFSPGEEQLRHEQHNRAMRDEKRAQPLHSQDQANGKLQTHTAESPMDPGGDSNAEPRDSHPTSATRLQPPPPSPQLSTTKGSSLLQSLSQSHQPSVPGSQQSAVNGAPGAASQTATSSSSSLVAVGSTAFSSSLSVSGYPGVSVGHNNLRMTTTTTATGFKSLRLPPQPATQLDGVQRSSVPPLSQSAPPAHFASAFFPGGMRLPFYAPPPPPPNQLLHAANGHPHFAALAGSGMHATNHTQPQYASSYVQQQQQKQKQLSVSGMQQSNLTPLHSPVAGPSSSSLSLPTQPNLSPPQLAAPTSNKAALTSFSSVAVTSSSIAAQSNLTPSTTLVSVLPPLSSSNRQSALPLPPFPLPIYTRDALLSPATFASFASRFHHWQRVDELNRRTLQADWEFRQCVISSRDKARHAEAAGVEVWLCEVERHRLEAELDRVHRSLQQLAEM